MVVEADHADVGPEGGERVGGNLEKNEYGYEELFGEIHLCRNTFGLALEMARSRVDFPALGKPMKPTWAMLRSSAGQGNVFIKKNPFFIRAFNWLTNVKDKFLRFPAVLGHPRGGVRRTPVNKRFL